MQAAQPVDRVGEPRTGSHYHDVLVEAVPRRGRRQYGVEAVIEGCLKVNVVEVVSTQPLFVPVRPGCPT